MAYNIIIALVLLLGVVICLWMREWKKRKAVEMEEIEKDRQLTKYIAENVDMEKALLEVKKKYAQQQDMAEEIKKMQMQSRLLKHDMKNHSLVILSYLEEGKVDEAKDYTSKILDNLNKMYTYITLIEKLNATKKL